MEDIIIRKATINDLYSIQELNNKLFELEYNCFDETLARGWPLTGEGKEYFKDMINNNFVFVAEYKNKVVGYLAGSVCEQIKYISQRYAELENMYIDDSYRELGIGTLLIKEFNKYCRSKNISNIKVTASAKNKKAIDFYIKNGFEDYNVTLKCKIEDK